MESQVSSIQQSTKTAWFADRGDNSGDILFAWPAGASCQVSPRDTTTQLSQRICAFGLGQNIIYNDVTWIRQAEKGTQAK